jgi:dihydrofolate reductase
MASKPTLCVIAAMARNRVIGIRNTLPWRLPEDLQHFKALTMGHHIVMGRKTFESIGKPLPNRLTVVLTRSQAAIPGVRTIGGLDELNPADPDLSGRDIYICGGAQVYQQALPLCSDLYLTVVQREVEGDTLMPPFEEQFDLAGEVLSQPDFRILHYIHRR